MSETPRTDEAYRRGLLKTDGVYLLAIVNSVVKESKKIETELNNLLLAIEGYDTTAVEYSEWQQRVKKAVGNCIKA